MHPVSCVCALSPAPLAFFMNSTKYILLTIDVEDWFQVENFKPWIPFETWDHRELRVERNVHLLLDLFDSVEVGEELESLEDRKPGSLEGGKVGTNAEIEYQNKELNEPNQHSQPNQLNNSSESVYNSQLTTNKSHAAAPASNIQQTEDNKHGEAANEQLTTDQQTHKKFA